MENLRTLRSFGLHLDVCVMILPVVVVLSVILTQSGQAQTLTVLHNFTTGLDGSLPNSGLMIDKAGILYGTANSGGVGGLGNGTVFKLSNNRQGGWIFTTLYDFLGGDDGKYPSDRPTFGPDGVLYGTTQGGGGSNECYTGCGTVFSLKPQTTSKGLSNCPTVSCPWTESVLYRFSGGSDGSWPTGELVFDNQGNLYGTAATGGNGKCTYFTGISGCGVVFKLTPSNGGWIQTVLYTFTGGSDGGLPNAGLTFDIAGNLYGTTILGGNFICDAQQGCGTVFRLTPSPSGWTENVLYAFTGGDDGLAASAGVIFDQFGNLYGATAHGPRGGAAFELTPWGNTWTYSLVYGFEGLGPTGSLIMDAAGNLYGTTDGGGTQGFGTAFELTRSGGIWTEIVLHDFTGLSDGIGAGGTLARDSNGNLYGSASDGGRYNDGTVWEIKP